MAITGVLKFDVSEEPLEGEVCLIPLVWDAFGSFFEALVVVRANLSQYGRIGRVSRDRTSDVRWLWGLTPRDTVIG
ncbi:hypothetical protein GGR53DRAFT_489975 [Hypoxylon sp. FL1150]|nr:hypothetical protein GGR53DRAFT_489975 [Hypoxylon sp. FL1150]